MSTLRCILATVREEASDSASTMNEAELLRHIGNGAKEVADAGLTHADPTTGWERQIVVAAVARIRRGERA